MKEAFRHFAAEEEPRSFRRLGAGHIHQTWAVDCESGARYVLQRLNTRVFAAPADIMDNLARLALALRGREDAPFLRFLDCRESGKLYTDGAGGVWRCYPFVPNSVALSQTEDREQLFQGAMAFGRFARALRDFPAASLHEPIPDFHNTPARFCQLRAALARDPCGRRRAVEREIAFVLAREERASLLQRQREGGELPLRVTHNDAKLGNVLVDADSGAALCVIDLDTVMPGLAAYDFGDLVRSGAAGAAEDEPQESRVFLDLSRCEALCGGYLCGFPELDARERESLPLGAYTMTLECGLRFLTDYLNGDKYFAVDREKHNLDRAHTQFKLVEDMEAKWDDLVRIVREVPGE